MDSIQEKQAFNREIGIRIQGLPGLAALAYCPGEDSLAAGLVFHLIDLELKRAGLTNGENLWYGQTNDCRMRFTVSDLGKALNCAHEALAASPMACNMVLTGIYWHDEAESLWRRKGGGADLLEDDFWSYADAVKFVESKREQAGMIADIIRAQLDKKKPE